MDITLLDGVDIEAFLDSATPEEIEAVHDYMEAIEAYKKYNKIFFFEPDAWQKIAIEKGVTETVRGVLAGNRLGKSYFGTYETAVHLTGRYPEGWTGHRFDKGPLNMVALGVDFTQIAKPDAMQELLIGKPEDRGCGFIPKDDIVRMTPKMGFRDVVSTIYVKHYDREGKEDGLSRLDFGSYNQGDEVLMGAAYDWFYIDECPSDDTILEQCKKRTWSTRGKGLCVFTPEKGMNATVEAFWDEKGVHHSGLVHVTLWDSSLYSDEEKKMMNDSIVPWQRSFSIEGIPSAGTGAVFAGIDKTSLLEPNIQVMPSWKRMAAVDFGFKDDNVVTFMAKDPSTGIYYLYDELVHSETDASIIAMAVKPRQHGYIPMIWPPDGDAERGAGQTLISIYRNNGVLTTDAQTRNYVLDPTGTNRSISAGITFIRELMRDGLLRISPACKGFLKEFDLYSYDKNGKFVDKNNHATDSLRYCITALDKFGVSENDSKKGKANEVSREEWSGFSEEFEGY